jgi:hypothetical protein
VRDECNFEFTAFDFIWRLPKPACHFKDVLWNNHRKCWSPLGVPSPDALSTYFEWGVENVDDKLEAFGFNFPAELNSVLTLDQAEFEDNHLARAQDSATVVPNKTEQPFLALNVPRHEVAPRAIRTEQCGEPFVKRYVDALGARR